MMSSLRQRILSCNLVLKIFTVAFQELVEVQRNDTGLTEITKVQKKVLKYSSSQGILDPTINDQIQKAEDPNTALATDFHYSRTPLVGKYLRAGSEYMSEFYLETDK
jgi:hypothetical protein